ncbi:MAG: hypothetical protein PHU73_05220, partial [Patescibacteria group bacterium]|nr:hypothetical protein [Patescibacteria group bacterium]
KTFHSVRIDKDYVGKNGQEYGKDIIELKDGSFLMASQGTGFVDSAYLKKKEQWDDVFLTKFDKQGNHLWTKMIGDYSVDRVYKVFATEDSGFVFSGYFSQTGFGEKTAPKYFVMAKYDKNGKNQWAKRIDIDYVDIEPLPKGGYIALGSIKTAGRESDLAEKFKDTAMPVIIKFNANFGVEWSKSLEIIPKEESVYSTDEAGHTSMKYRTLRDAAGKFIAIKQTSGGYIAFGYLSPTLSGGNPNWSTAPSIYNLVAVKIDYSGKLQWAKTIKPGIKLDSEIRETSVIKTKDENFVLKMNYLPPPRNDQENKMDFVNEKSDQLDAVCERKNRVKDCENGKITNDPEILLAWEDYIKTAKSFETQLNNGLVLLKTDTDFNPLWSKKINLEDYVYGYAVEPTLDNGCIVAGSYNTSILNYSNSMGQGYFQNTLLIKLDVNGQVTNNQGMISDYTDLSSGDVDSFLALNDFPPTVKNLVIKINKTVQPKISSLKTIVRDISPATASTATPINPNNFPKITSSTTSPIATNCAEIAYENTDGLTEFKPIYHTASEIHQELLPVLNELYANKVKLKKDLSGVMEYVFGRLVTEADIAAVKQYLEGLGYKTYSTDTDQLVMMKIGRTLTLTFTLTDKTRGSLFVSY